MKKKRVKHGKHEARTVYDKPPAFRRANAGYNKQLQQLIKYDRERCIALGVNPRDKDALDNCTDDLNEVRWRRQDNIDARWKPLRGPVQRKRRTTKTKSTTRKRSRK